MWKSSIKKKVQFKKRVIDIDTDDIMSCRNCGVFFDANIVKKERTGFGSMYFIYPVCKNKNH